MPQSGCVREDAPASPYEVAVSTIDGVPSVTDRSVPLWIIHTFNATTSLRVPPGAFECDRLRLPEGVARLM